jgi:altronate dehydratase small subunit
MTVTSNVPMDAIMLNEADHVATALVPLKPGQRVNLRVGRQDRIVEIYEDIPRYHKFAVADICQDTMIRKGGEVIGRLYAAVKAGRHVHTHNLVGASAR